MEKVNWKLDKQNTSSYIDLCCRAVDDEIIFAKFRNMNPMTLIVENSPEKSGQEYYQCIVEHYPWLFEFFNTFMKSDMLGSPVKYHIGQYQISPTTLRYIKTLGDLHKFFGSLSGMTIAEIGGGYGGLCKVINDVYKPTDYYVFDLPEPLALQKKFLSHFNVTPVTGEYPERIDLLIAMYSWSELSEELQVEYLEKVISKAKNCYIMLNYDMVYSYELLRNALPNAWITSHNLFYDDSNTEYAPYNRFVIIKN